MSGFIGSHVARALLRRGHKVTRIPSPRVTLDHRKPHIDVMRDARLLERTRSDLMEQLATSDVVVNCAGIPDAGAPGTRELYGANALLPALLGVLCADAGVYRLLHVSSAAVHGRAPVLIEGGPASPFSPYSRSKLMGELLLVRATAAMSGMDVIRYRPTSVHGVTRDVTRRLVAIAHSPLNTIVGDGAAPTPQVLVEDVARAVVLLVECKEPPRDPVLHPWEGLTTGKLMTLLGDGRHPRKVPTVVARRVLQLSSIMPSPKMQGLSRKLEMLWFGQRQESNALERLGYVPTRDWAAWARMAVTVRQPRPGVEGAVSSSPPDARTLEICASEGSDDSQSQG
ncbi:NAD-dependent epimerase/dehydratase family protein [Blastococcus sp. SYSU DS1021]